MYVGSGGGGGERRRRRRRWSRGEESGGFRVESCRHLIFIGLRMREPDGAESGEDFGAFKKKRCIRVITLSK